MKSKKSFISLFIFFCYFFINLSCKHTPSFSEHIQNKDCELALTEVPENQNLYKVSQVSQQASGTLISYSFTGAAYTAQILWDVSVGITTGIILCAPAIAVMMASHSSAAPPNSCFPANIHPLLSPPLGKNTYESTQTLRCPPLTGLSQSIRKVAKCYADNHTKIDTEKAIKILENTEASESFYQCLPNTEISLFINDLKTYREQKNSF